jgi:AbrB family looped-hinge helix DNA binding protein
MTGNTTTVSIDKAGRIIVPKALRDALHFKAGDELEIAQEGDGFVVRHKAPKTQLIKKKGLWVLRTSGGPITNEMVNETLERVRHEREVRASGYDDDLL